MPMRLKNIALALALATALAGCNDTLDSVDVSKIKNKVEHPLPSRIVAEMQKKNMPRTSPIMIRIFKEEGVLEVWKAKADNRFDMISSYQICAWSGKLGPKKKEGDRQAPEGFYNLTPAHLNPNSKYFLAINTGFPNRYDQVNGRTGSDLMIHGACSSSGCYSMTDEQVLEIYAFARDAFKGGQSAVQLQAFPFRMTAENMARHRGSEHYDFWQMLKTGYDNFEVTKRPPEVNVCEKRYVFNQQVEGAATFNAAAACPPMSTSPGLMAALASHQQSYEVAYAKAVKKLDGMVWYEPSEAERKAVVAEKRKGRDVAYAPTGTSLEAGKLMKREEFEALMARRTAPESKPATTMLASTSARPATAAERMKQDRLPRQQSEIAAAPTAEPTATADASSSTVPIPVQNPMAYAAPPVSDSKKRPFWKFWSQE
ncbi:transpeptidase [Pseudorhizobium halotolerans]|uniref:Transpeptidase n=2 Tax=Pseudorhizobium halotolerans TaxID=1233081 RepID=A0ABM8PCA0_9HYPH|nr:transpeptidase [Pseudorhizobium halotolerans]